MESMKKRYTLRDPVDPGLVLRLHPLQHRGLMKVITAAVSVDEEDLILRLLTGDARSPSDLHRLVPPPDAFKPELEPRLSQIQHFSVRSATSSRLLLPAAGPWFAQE